MDKRSILIIVVLISLIVVVKYVVPFGDVVMPGWNTLMIPAEAIKSIVALILLVLLGIYLYVQIRKIPKK